MFRQDIDKDRRHRQRPTTGSGLWTRKDWTSLPVPRNGFSDRQRALQEVNTAYANASNL
jgi:hypothetical protein